MGVGENRNWLNNSILPNPTPVEGHVRFFQATGMSSRAVACAFNSCHSTSCHFKIMWINMFSPEDYVRKSHSDTS